MKVFYIHHGQRKRTKRAGLEDDLTVLGEKDAALTGKILSCYKDKVRAIYTSNFFRCKKTAQIINQNFEVKIIEEARLNEFGSLKGESWTELQMRIMDFLDEICQSYCGSARFKEQHLKVQSKLTLQGNIVIPCVFFDNNVSKSVWDNLSEAEKVQTKALLDDMHKRKIDLADEIFVINKDGYVGQSTKSEIDYALKQGKKINYWIWH